jgi:hypothetical protein
MGVLLAVVAWLKTRPTDLNWVVAACGYIAFFTGVPTVVMRGLRPRISAFRLRVAILVLLSASMVLPDVLYYVIARPEVFDLDFASRHLFNPLRTVANWPTVEKESLFVVPQLLGMIGLAAYSALIVMNLRDAKRAEHVA